MIGDAGHRIDKIVTMYDQINNILSHCEQESTMISLNHRLNQRRLQRKSIWKQRRDGFLQVKTPLDKIEKDLSEASQALLKASGVNRPQENDSAPRKDVRSLQSVEPGMRDKSTLTESSPKKSKDSSRELGTSNYLIYDKVIRGQKIANIDHKCRSLKRFVSTPQVSPRRSLILWQLQQW